MNHFLFVVDVPAPGLSSQDPEAALRWHGFEAKCNDVSLSRGGSKLPCKNVWLFPVEGSEPSLRQFANIAEEFRLSHATFLVSGDVTPTRKTKP